MHKWFEPLFSDSFEVLRKIMANLISKFVPVVSGQYLVRRVALAAGRPDIRERRIAEPARRGHQRTVAGEQSEPGLFGTRERAERVRPRVPCVGQADAERGARRPIDEIRNERGALLVDEIAIVRGWPRETAEAQLGKALSKYNLKNQLPS